MMTDFSGTRIVDVGTLCVDCFNKGRVEEKNFLIKRPLKKVFCVRCAKTVRTGFEVNELVLVEVPKMRQPTPV